MKIKDKKCPICKMLFIPTNSLQKVCGYKCAIDLLDIDKKTKIKKADNEKKKETREAKEKLKTKKDYLNELQVIFNTYIRLRDYCKKCISCDMYLMNVKYDAGHFLSIGSNPALRFDEDNVFGQCVHDNRDKHGNLIEYGERLKERIGVERYEALMERRHNERHYTIEELKELKINI